MRILRGLSFAESSGIVSSVRVFVVAYYMYKTCPRLDLFGSVCKGWMDELGFYVSSTVFQSF